ncbi:MAG TPA: DUF4292 domain-containing protein [Cytophagaceae bacterium]|jgi:hypothetical protein|nr:DUF4292 domain-containing protein [Cytophagaceae bacterium]
MNKFLLFIGLFFLFLSVSCKKPIAVSSVPKVDTTDFSLLRKFKINEIDFVYFHFKSKIEYEEGSESQNFTINGRIKKDSIIWLSITPGLGIEVVRCLILKDSVFVLDRIHNKIYTYGFSYINNLFNTNLTFSNLQSMIVGNLTFPIDKKDKLVKQEDLGFYLLRQNGNNLKVDNYVLTQNLKIETLEILNVDNNSSLSLKYSDFAPLDSFLFANHIKTVAKFVDNKGMSKSAFIDIQHHKAEIVTKPLNFPFNVPKRFEEK